MLATITATMTAPIAQFFVDETGDFSSPVGDMRVVGGLLVVASAAVAKDLQQMHDAITRKLDWQVRLHARELVEPGLVLRWHAAGGSQNANLSPTEMRALGATLAKYPQTPPHQQGRIWVPPSKVPLTATYYRTLQDVGRKLLHQSQAMLLAGFQSWCGPNRRAFVILGHVDEKVPGGARAYDTALRIALELGTETALKAGATQMNVEIAAPIVQGAPDIRALAARVPGVGNVDVVRYDDGSGGLLLADSLLAWSRPPRSPLGSALDPKTGVRKCIRASSSVPQTRPTVRETVFDLFRDAVVDTEELP